ncbi:hypothetical protein SK128_027162 [Halocaridina rubra]|uniref:Reelin domain-containing protein n=1 Tax=Halocaridina rubra TaxID=373956 RepID=A0AAN8X0L1_HALRR
MLEALQQRIILDSVCYLLVLQSLTSAYPDHVPESACSWMSPWHEPYTESQSSSPPYKLQIYHPNVLVNMTVPICVVGGEPFMGMMIQARDLDGNAIGSWHITDPEKAQTLNCSNPVSSHSQNW